MSNGNQSIGGGRWVAGNLDPGKASPIGLRVVEVPRGQRLLTCTLTAARALEVPVSEARIWLGRLPAIWPRSLKVETLRVADSFTDLGARVELIAGLSTPFACHDHPRLDGDESCQDCGCPICSVCVALSNRVKTCRNCRRVRRRARYFFRAKLAVGLVILLLMMVWGAIEARSRSGQLGVAELGGQSLASKPWQHQRAKGIDARAPTIEATRP